MELRWLVRKWKDIPTITGYVEEMEDEPVLQYRPVSLNPYEDGPDLMYGEWKDVPTVIESTDT